MFQHIVTVFQHIATDTVSTTIYIFSFCVFSKKKLLEILFCKFIIKMEVGSDVVSAVVTAIVPASHVYS